MHIRGIIGRRGFVWLSLAGASAFLMRPLLLAAPRRSREAKPVPGDLSSRSRLIEGQPTASQPLREHGRYILSLHAQES